jgi:hypothetical protein
MEEQKADEQAAESQKGAEAQKIELDLSSTSAETIELFVEESSDPDLFQEILLKNRNRVDVMRVLLTNPNTPDDVRSEAAKILSLPVPTADTMAEMRRRVAESKAKDIQNERLVRKIQRLSVAEKIKLALKTAAQGLEQARCHECS